MRCFLIIILNFIFFFEGYGQIINNLFYEYNSCEVDAKSGATKTKSNGYIKDKFYFYSPNFHFNASLKSRLNGDRMRKFNYSDNDLRASAASHHQKLPNTYFLVGVEKKDSDSDSLGFSYLNTHLMGRYDIKYNNWEFTPSAYFYYSTMGNLKDYNSEFSADVSGKISENFTLNGFFIYHDDLNKEHDTYNYFRTKIGAGYRFKTYNFRLEPVVWGGYDGFNSDIGKNSFAALDLNLVYNITHAFRVRLLNYTYSVISGDNDYYTNKTQLFFNYVFGDRNFGPDKIFIYTSYNDKSIFQFKRYGGGLNLWIGDFLSSAKCEYRDSYFNETMYYEGELRYFLSPLNNLFINGSFVDFIDDPTHFGSRLILQAGIEARL